MSDIPAGTGMGSSGSFTTALLKGLHLLKKNSLPPKELAEQACHIEMNLLREPVGKQDQYIAAFGGLMAFSIDPSGEVEVEPLRMSPETLHNLEDNTALFFTGFTRAASEILKDQDDKTKQDDAQMIDNLHTVKQIGYDSRKVLEKGDLRCFAELMHVHWQNKRARSAHMTNSAIDEYYETGRANGALGGKVIGAGGGGFLMFYSEDKTRLRRVMTSLGLREVRMRFDFEGTKVLAQS
jgi:D-glycero-alpha-D-manno-heptose-7-phosphate kinase